MMVRQANLQFVVIQTEAERVLDRPFDNGSRNSRRPIRGGQVLVNGIDIQPLQGRSR